MRSSSTAGPAQAWHLPDEGVFRVHYDPAALPRLDDAAGLNRFDDPRPRTADRYWMRYTATTLRGCLLELLDWLRGDDEAAEREAAVVDDDRGGPPPMAAAPWQAIEDYLSGRQVGVITGPGLTLVSINDPGLQAQLDQEAGVRALLDSSAGVQALQVAGATGGRRVHLDGAAVRLSSELGREITRACSLALRDRPTPPDGIHYRSRHDDAEECWAIYDHAPVNVRDVIRLSPHDQAHRDALHAVAALWHLPLPPQW